MIPQVLLVACEHGHCRRKVFRAKIMKQSGAPVDVVLDAEASDWAYGARIKLTGVNSIGEQLARKLTLSQIHEAFAVRELYVEHSERCEVAMKRKPAARKREGHA